MAPQDWLTQVVNNLIISGFLVGFINKLIFQDGKDPCGKRAIHLWSKYTEGEIPTLHPVSLIINMNQIIEIIIRIMSHRVMLCSGMWGRGNWAMVPRVVLRSLTTLASTSGKYLPSWYWNYHPQASCQVQNWVSDTGRPWQKALCLYSSWPSQTSTKWIDRSALWSPSILYWTCEVLTKKAACNIPQCHCIPCFSFDSYNLGVEQNFLNLFPHSHPRTQSQPSAISSPGHLFWTL